MDVQASQLFNLIAAAFGLLISVLFWALVLSKINALIRNGEETNRLLTLLVHEQNRSRRSLPVEPEQPE